MTFKRIMVLLWADILGGYAIWTLQTYLTGVWKMEVTHAAGIINVSSGLAKALPLLFVFMTDTFLGDYWMLLLSSISYAAGLGLLSMSTPPVLAKTTNTCSDYKPECVGQTQKGLFYAALALLVVGISGHIVSLVAYMKAQSDDPKQDDTTVNENQFQPVDAVFALVKEHKIRSFRIIILMLIPAVAIIALPYVHPWSIRFGVPAICSVVATFFFLFGGCQKRKVREDQELPNNVESVESDRPAAIVSSPNMGEQVKFVIHMSPLWLTFIFCGVVSSLGNTYFVEQAKNMSYKVGKIKAPITILLIVYDIFKKVFTTIYLLVVDFFKVAGLERYVPAFGIGIALIFSCLCCITAAKIENRRIHVITNHGLLDKPDEKIPMTVFWLVFQFILLAGHDSLAENSINRFFSNESPESMKKYLLYFTQAVNGLGIMGSILSVFIVGKVSESKGHTSWFQDTLNKSRLDKYFWVLTCMSVGNLIWHTFFSCLFPYKKRVFDNSDLLSYGNGNA